MTLVHDSLGESQERVTPKAALDDCSCDFLDRGSDSSRVAESEVLRAYRAGCVEVFKGNKSFPNALAPDGRLIEPCSSVGG